MYAIKGMYMKNQYLLFIGFVIIIFFSGAGGMMLASLYKSNSRLHIETEPLPECIENNRKDNNDKPIIERIVTAALVWRPIQEMVKDTDVQVYAQIADIDML